MANDRPPKPPATPAVTRPSARNPIPDASRTVPSAPPPRREPSIARPAKTVLTGTAPVREPSIRSSGLRPAVDDPRGGAATPSALDATNAMFAPPADAPAMRERPAPRPWIPVAALAVLLALTGAVIFRGRVAEEAAQAARVAVDPAAAAEARRLLKEGDAAVSGARLSDARWYYWKAVEQDPGCDACRTKLDSLEERLVKDVREGLLAGDSNLQNGRYAEAIAHFERVQSLDPDPASVNFMNAEAGLRKARSAMGERGR